MTALDARTCRKISPTGQARGPARGPGAPVLEIEALGSGSDFTPFLQHIGIASLNVGFGGESNGGIYHSIYDDFTWYTRFGDTDFAYARALAQTVGTLTLRLANADVLPFDFTGSSDAIARYVKEVAELADTKRRGTEKKEPAASRRTCRGRSRTRRSPSSPRSRASSPHFDFSPLQNASDALTAAAAAYARAFDAAFLRGRRDPARAPPARRTRALRSSSAASPPRPGCPAGRGTSTSSTRPAPTPATASRRCPPCARRSSRRRWDDVNAAPNRRRDREGGRARWIAARARGSSSRPFAAKPAPAEATREPLLRRACARRSPGCRILPRAIAQVPSQRAVTRPSPSKISAAAKTRFSPERIEARLGDDPVAARRPKEAHREVHGRRARVRPRRASRPCR